MPTVSATQHSTLLHSPVSAWDWRLMDLVSACDHPSLLRGFTADPLLPAGQRRQGAMHMTWDSSMSHRIPHTLLLLPSRKE